MLISKYVLLEEMKEASVVVVVAVVAVVAVAVVVQQTKDTWKVREPVAKISVVFPPTFHAVSSAPVAMPYCLPSFFHERHSYRLSGR